MRPLTKPHGVDVVSCDANGIETQLIPVTAARSFVAPLRGMYGFAWNPGGTGNTVPVTAAVTVEVEDEPHEGHSVARVRRMSIRPGVWYGSRRPARQAFIVSSVAGSIALDVGMDPDAVALALTPANAEGTTAGAPSLMGVRDSGGLVRVPHAFEPVTGQGYALRTAPLGLLLSNAGAVGGALVDSGDLDTSGVGQLAVLCWNGDSVTRNLTLTCRDALSNIMDTLTFPVTAGATVRVAMGLGATSSSGVTAHAMPVPPKLRLTVPANAGAGTVSTATWGR